MHVWLCLHLRTDKLTCTHFLLPYVIHTHTYTYTHAHTPTPTQSHTSNNIHLHLAVNMSPFLSTPPPPAFPCQLQLPVWYRRVAYCWGEYSLAWRGLVDRRVAEYFCGFVYLLVLPFKLATCFKSVSFTVLFRYCNKCTPNSDNPY